MAKILKKHLSFRNIAYILAVMTILFLGNKLREYEYAKVPFPGETRDEYSFGWLGISLIRDKYPTAWSGIEGYKYSREEDINVDNIFTGHPEEVPFTINKPWFDHPPLFGLLVGGYAYTKGIREFKDASVIILRRPMLKIGVLSVLLVSILAWQLFGPMTGVISGLLYAIIPSVVISSRLALAENGYIPLFLGGVLSAYLYFTKKDKRFWYIACFLAAAGVLFKLSGISIFLSLVLLSLILENKEKACLLKILFSFVGLTLLLYLVYGYYYGIDTFLRVLATNSSRFFGAGAEIFYGAVVSTKITGSKTLTDGWILLGWIAFFIYLFRNTLFGKKDNIIYIIVPAVSYFIVFIVFGSESYGWYRYPFYPFLIIFAGKLLYELIVSPNVLYLFLILLPFGTSSHRLFGTVGFNDYSAIFRVGVVGIFSIFMGSFFLNKHTSILLQRIATVMVFLLVSYLSVKEVYFYDFAHWIFAN
jgi:4-amino-4-deoxy-L-arabinose transferase-like glycosyltransferase